MQPYFFVRDFFLDLGNVVWIPLNGERRLLNRFSDIYILVRVT